MHDSDSPVAQLLQLTRLEDPTVTYQNPGLNRGKRSSAKPPMGYRVKTVSDIARSYDLENLNLNFRVPDSDDLQKVSPRRAQFFTTASCYRPGGGVDPGLLFKGVDLTT